MAEDMGMVVSTAWRPPERLRSFIVSILRMEQIRWGGCRLRTETSTEPQHSTAGMAMALRTK